MADTSLGTSRINPRAGRRASASAPVADAIQSGGQKLSVVVWLFIFSLVLPNIFFIGPLKLSLYKLILLVMILPLLVQWISQKAGPPKGVDFLVLGFSSWIFIALFVVHGFDRFETAGIRMLETIGAYLLARVYIRTPEQFYKFITALCLVVLAMLPLAFIEAATSRIPINEIMGKFTGVNPDLQHEMRFGMHRVQGPFEHPILFGVFCATLTAPAFLIWGYGHAPFKRLLRVGVPGLATFLSLSMGAYISMIIQIALFSWDYIFRKVQARWMLLFGIFLALYIGIDLLSNRSPVKVFISYLSFNSSASYNRLLIWEYGSAEVLRHPIFGIGFNDWQRPYWMVPSIDNFWLLTAMVYGLPAIILLMSAFIRTIIVTGKLDFTNSPMMRSYRLAYLVAIGGLMLSLCTVHVWNATYVFLLFFLGAGVWMRDYVVPDPEADTQETPDAPDDGPQYYSPRRKPAKVVSARKNPNRRSPYTRG